MMLTRAFLSAAVKDMEFMGLGECSLGESPLSWTGFCIDSRLIRSGEFFVALIGKKHNGHAFIADVVARGAIGLLIARSQKSCLDVLAPQVRDSLFIMIVEDTHSAFLAIAYAWRQKIKASVVGITGSVGKTTTKEMLAASVCASGKKCVASEGNQNTLLGAALTIMRVRPEHDVVIFEMGISKRGEMAELVDLVKPTHATITTIGHSHLEGLGSYLDIVIEKRDIFSRFFSGNVGIINGDIPLLSNMSYNHPVVRVGQKMSNQIQARKVQVSSHSISCVIKIYQEKYAVTLPTGHIGRVTNALSCIALGHSLGLPHDVLIESVQKSYDVAGRFERRLSKKHDSFFINDCYNASPESMKTALLTFERLDAQGKKIAVIGDMLGLGVNSLFWHRQLGRFLRKVPSLSKVVFVGSSVEWANKTCPFGLERVCVPSWKEACKVLESELSPQSLVLVKGSHDMGLSNLVDTFCVQEGL
ncbi:MAG: UDP-N-acetylmuramoyl-tripeptide-D-alanyl-D-alanine ligase [candidate division TM6 bacterium GW2011_GWE2_41_16]|nr:MAG: UDP-N-acetylmuramoyl-tripeptide-D-alanyl-D-alanine ligase [candidate division TM6 bacterium GW2011_GWE2_41_16]